MPYNHRKVILVIALTVLVSNVSISIAEVLVITSSEENTLPVFEVYNVTEDIVDTVEKVGRKALETIMLPVFCFRFWVLEDLT